MTLLWFTEVLLEAAVTEEEIVSTQAFARHAVVLWAIQNSEERATVAHKLVGRYPAFDLVEVINGVPVLRMKHAMVEVVRYPRIIAKPQIQLGSGFVSCSQKTVPSE